MDIVSFDGPVTFDDGRYHGSIDQIAGNVLGGWVGSKSTRPAALRITASSARGSVTTSNREPRPDVAAALGCDAACGYRLPLAQVVTLADLLTVRDDQRLAFRLCIETESGEPVARFVVALTRRDLLKARFRTHLEPDHHAVSGWHVDFGGDETYAPRFVMRNTLGEVQNLPLQDARDVREAFPHARAWRWAAAHDAAFTVRKLPLTVVVAHGPHIVQEEPLLVPPVLFHASRIDGAVIGWAIDPANPDVRPRVTLRDAAETMRSAKACLYRPDVRALVPGFDGFCGFLIPTQHMAGPLVLDLVGVGGVIGAAELSMPALEPAPPDK